MSTPRNEKREDKADNLKEAMTMYAQHGVNLKRKCSINELIS